MKTNDKIYTPRFCTVTIDRIYEDSESARKDGYSEPTYYDDPEYIVVGKSLDLYHMTFAAYRK